MWFIFGYKLQNMKSNNVSATLQQRFYDEGYRLGKFYGFICFADLRKRFPEVDFSGFEIFDLISELVEGFEKGWKEQS